MFHNDSTNKSTAVSADSISTLKTARDIAPNNEVQSTRSILQVELNTIASSFGCLSNKISDMHKIFDIKTETSVEDTKSSQLPPNAPMAAIAASMIGAHNEYIRQTNSMNCVILFIIQVFPFIYLN